MNIQNRLYIKHMVKISFKFQRYLPYYLYLLFFSILGIINARFISYKSGYKYLLYKTLLLAIVSIPLSYFLITSYGIVGAATSILIMEILSCTIFNYFFERNIILKSHLRIFTSLGYAKKILRR